MAKLVNKSPNAANNVNGIAFEKVNGHMVSVEHLSDADLAYFAQLPHFLVLEDRPLAPVGATSDAPEGSNGSLVDGQQTGDAKTEPAAAAQPEAIKQPDSKPKAEATPKVEKKPKAEATPKK